MAETVVAFVLQALSDRLDSITTASGNTRITRILTKTQFLILKAKDLSDDRSDKSSHKYWQMKVKDVAYDADVLVDEYQTIMMMKKKVSYFGFFFFSSRIERKMKVINERFGHLLENAIEIRSAAPSKAVETSPSSNLDKQSSSFISEFGIYGRELDKWNIVEMLFSESEHEIRVIPIVGMGGIGKTTLAQLVYNDEQVKKHFELRYWICVGENFDVARVAGAIMRSPIFDSNMDTLESAVRNILNGKKFLIVLDDAWSEDRHKWAILRNWFSNGAQGSVVIVTTRSINVAEMMGRVPAYHLKLLPDEDCWSLFKHVAFGSMEEEDVNLVEIGREIVSRCSGLPLQAKLLGGLLRSKRTVSEWLYIKNSDMSDVLAVLELSYDHLPSHLKQCFGYCSIFPKGYWINKEKLIQLWIAEGFVHSTGGGSITLEDTAEDYFMGLLGHSLFEDVVSDGYGNVLECRMHDLVHDLALFVAGTECSIVETVGVKDLTRNVRHLSLSCKSKPFTIPEVLQEAKKLRTLLVLSGKFENVRPLFLRFSCLRVLDMSCSGISELPVSIGTLIHLRYLDLSRTYIRMIPESIGNLIILQTLKLFKCYILLELPKAISELISLRHLDIRSCCSLSYMPPGIGKLSNLQTLSAFILGESNDCALLSELTELDLGGRLEIKNLENVRSLADAGEAGLFEKQKLHSLEYLWGDYVGSWSDISAEVFERLRPSPNLKGLDIVGYKPSIFPSWIMNQGLLNLVKVSLINCASEQLPPLGQLLHLKDLFIQQMFAVKVIGYEFYGDSIVRGFPSLKQLELDDMPNLLEWKSLKKEETGSLAIVGDSSGQVSEVFPCLDTLTVKGCKMLTGLPSIPNLINLTLWNSNGMLLQSLAHLPSLSTLVINELQGPMFLPMGLGNINFMKKLTVFDCDDLETLFEGMVGFTSLEHLRILCCHGLTSLPMEILFLTSLKKLEIVDCEQFAGIPNFKQTLPSLEELIIDNCPIVELAR